MEKITIKRLSEKNSLKYEKEIIELDRLTLGTISKKFVFLKGLKLRKLHTNISCDERTRQRFSFFAVTGNKVVGLVVASVLEENKKSIYIQKLGVHPIFQKKGIAKNLIKKTAEAAFKQKITCIFLRVSDKNKVRKWYLKIFEKRLHDKSMKKTLIFSADPSFILKKLS